MTRPRRATATWLKQMNRLMFHATGEGYVRFLNEDDLKGMSLHAASADFDPHSVLFADKLEVLRLLPVPCSMTISVDQEQLQLTGLSFLENSLRATVVTSYDFFHRYWNGLQDATARSGLYSVYYAAHLVYNVAYGPYQSCSWFHTILASAADMAACLEPDSPWLLRFWDGILCDQGKQYDRSDAVRGRQGRERFLEGLKGKRILDIHNAKAKTSTWFSFHAAHAEWDKSIHEKGLAIAFACMRKGWIVTVEDLFMPLSNCGVLPVVGDQGDAASSKHVAADAAPKGSEEKSKAAAVRTAKSKLAALKAASQNNLAAAARLICDPDVINGSRAIALGSKALYDDFSNVQRRLKGPESAVEHVRGLCQYKFLDVLKETLRSRDDVTALGRCGFDVEFPGRVTNGLDASSGTVRYQDSLAHALGTFTQRIIANRCGSMCVYTSSYPGKLLGALRLETELETMQEFGTFVDAYLAAKERARAATRSERSLAAKETESETVRRQSRREEFVMSVSYIKP